MSDGPFTPTYLQSIERKATTPFRPVSPTPKNAISANQRRSEYIFGFQLLRLRRPQWPLVVFNLFRFEQSPRFTMVLIGSAL